MLRVLRNWYHDNKVYTPNASTIDFSGVINSDHPKIDNGWVKGWLVDTGKNDTIIVCLHSNPSVLTPTNTVFAKDNDGVKHTRKIVAVEKIKQTDYYFDETGHLDIAICSLNAPFPSNIIAYKFAEDLNNGQKVLTPNQHGEITQARLKLSSRHCAISGAKRAPLLMPGDSGLPWFVWEENEWRVATHLHLGWWGIGPWYSHEKVYPALRRKLNLPESINKNKSWIEKLISLFFGKQ